VVSRETLFQSPVALTPYASEERIDEARLGAIIDDAYGAARIGPDDIDTGVVILTGEALRRENAQAIAALIGRKAATSSAPPPATTWSRCSPATAPAPHGVVGDEAKRSPTSTLRGTTKLGLVENGKVIATRRCMSAARLQVVDEAARSCGSIRRKHQCQAARGSRGTAATARPTGHGQVADAMADALVAAINGAAAAHDIAHLYLTIPSPSFAAFDA